MGKRGPKPTPTKILQLRGSWVPRARGMTSEPILRVEAPDLSTVLETDEEKAEWDRLCGLLLGMGVLSRVDGNALARYVRLFVRWRQVDAFLRKYGDVRPVKGEGDEIEFVQFPQSNVAIKLAPQLLRLEQEFGLTPSSRTGLVNENARNDNPLSDFTAQKSV